ncbi:MAG: ABC transporter ATP-binding protein [Longimicrobiales bacterium]|nr:ABC transporter ATP-binding protein [Longimicrobiales bacterium]
MIRMEGLTKRYGKFTAVHPLDLEVPAGQLFGFLGPNGAGKTTTIRMLTGVLRPSGGRVSIGGHDVVDEPDRAKQLLGYIPDRPFLYEKLTGREFLRFVSGLWGQDGKAAAARGDELMELFELSDWKDTLIESYSHGMRQKLLISSALIHGPRLIVVDEPMVGLDPKAARLIKDLLRTFVREGGTIFLSTHTLEVAEALCDRIAIIQDGRIRAAGTMDELRAEAEAGAAGLEEIFLKLTGGEDVAELIASLKNVAEG